MIDTSEFVPTYARAAEMFPPLPSGLPAGFQTVSYRRPKTDSDSSSSGSAGSSASSGSGSGRFGFQKERFLENFFTKLHPVSGHKGLHSILGALYRAKPACFVCPEGIHNSSDGSKTYLSVRVYTSNTLHYNIHIYGIMRGNIFNVTNSETFMHHDSEQVTYECVFRQIAAVPEAINIW
jgi:hypothetical protein